MFTWDDMLKATPQKRKQLWEQLQKNSPEAAEYWEDSEACNEDVQCQFLKDGWCGLYELPVSFNPYLTPRTGMIGMACMGARPPQQISLFT